jgi:tetratricopeptide (TPR) repeat protein
MTRTRAIIAVVALAAVAGVAAWRMARQGRTPGRAGDQAAATFVGSAACAPCHAEEQRLWRDSHHARSMQPATAATVLGDFGGARVEYAGIVSRFFRDRDRFMVRTDGPDGGVQDYQVRYTFGVFPLQQVLIALPGGRLQALGIAWDSRPKDRGGQRWFHLYPGEHVTHDDQLHWTRWSQNWNLQCAECHSTNLRKNYDMATRDYRTTWSEIDVGCEACHGPGSAHVAWARAARDTARRDARGLAILLDERRDVRWSVDPRSGQPLRSTPRGTDTEIQLCARCHSRRGVISEDYRYGRPLMDTHLPALLTAGLYHDDGQIEAEDYEVGSFAQSRMAHAGVTCSDCHDPHRGELRSPGDGVCLRCHEANRYDTAGHHFHTAGSKGASCIACHMPSRTYMVVHERRDHSLRIPRPDLSVTLGTPNACTGCHADRSAAWAAARVRSWYGADPAGYQGFAAALHAARTSAVDAEARLVALLRDADQPAIARATAAANLARWLSPASIGALSDALRDADPQVRMGALEALEPLTPEERRPLVAPLLADSVRAVRILAADALAGLPAGALSPAERANFERAAAEYVAAQTLNADQPGPLVNLGNFYAARGDSARAEQLCRSAIELDRDWVPAYVNLADLLRQAGRDPEGEQVLRVGLARQPRDGSLHYSLGLLQVREKRMAQALASLERAAQLSPDDTRFACVYAVALHEAGRARDALATIDAALKRAPGDRPLQELHAQATGTWPRP